MRHLLLTVVLAFFTYMGFAQNGVLKGNISDDGQPVSFASVVVTDNDKRTGASADVNGNYSLNLSPGTYNVTVSAVGYRIDKQQVTIQSGKTTTLDVVLAEDMLGLDQVVVTGSRSEMPSYNAPVVVNKITAKTLDMTQSLSLSEGLNFSPGLRMETNCQNCGFNQLRINGLSGGYSQILINSRPVFSALTGVYGLEMIPANMIDRIEVVKGGGSALYGGNAIGGTVNIITKDPTEDTYEVGTNLSFMRGKTLDRTIHVNGSIVSDDLNKGISFFAYNRDRKPFDANDDGYSEMTKLKNSTFGADLFWNTSDRSKLKLDFNSITEFRRGGNAFDFQPHEAGITEQLRHSILGGDLSFEISSNDFRHKLTLYTSLQNTERNSYYGEGGLKINSFSDLNNIEGVVKTLSDIEKEAGSLDDEDIEKWVDKEYPGKTDEEKGKIIKKIKEKSDYFIALNAYGKSHDLSSATGVQYHYNINDGLKLSLGTEFQYNHVTDEMLGYGRKIDQRVGTSGNYAQLEWTVVKPFTLLIGGRYDYSRLEGDYDYTAKNFKIDRTFHNFVPRITAKYDFSDNWKLRGSFAQGYRIPQAFDEDLHVASVGGDAQFVEITKDLKPEKSNNFTASVNYVKAIGDWQANIVFEGFYTHLKDPFAPKRNADGTEVEKEDASGVIIKQKTNAVAAVVKGVNLEANFAYLDKFILQMGVTLQSSKYEEPFIIWADKNDPDGRKPVAITRILRAPNAYGFFATTYNPTDALSFSYSGVFTGSMLVTHLRGDNEYPERVDTPSFFEHNLKASYRYKTSDHYFVELSAGVQNILDSYQKDFDKGGNRDSTYIYGPVRPRTYFVGLKFGLD